MAYKLIVADGSPSIQRVAELAFNELNFEVYSFGDGLEAMAAIERLHPDAILLSPRLETKDGYEVGRFLAAREDLRDAVLVVLKGQFEPLDRESLAGIPIDRIVRKPFDSTDLARTTLEMINQKKGPHSLPEELIWEEDWPDEFSGPLDPDDDDTVDGLEKPPQKADSAAADLEGRLAESEARLKEFLKQEILQVEREVEKRVRMKLLSELEGRPAGKDRDS